MQAEKVDVLDINIAGRRKSALVDTRLLGSFILKKATSKLGLLVRKLNKKIKKGNVKEVPTVGVAQGVTPISCSVIEIGLLSVTVQVRTFHFN